MRAFVSTRHWIALSDLKRVNLSCERGEMGWRTLYEAVVRRPSNPPCIVMKHDGAADIVWTSGVGSEAVGLTLPSVSTHRPCYWHTSDNGILRWIDFTCSAVAEKKFWILMASLAPYVEDGSD